MTSRIPTFASLASLALALAAGLAGCKSPPQIHCDTKVCYLPDGTCQSVTTGETVCCPGTCQPPPVEPPIKPPPEPDHCHCDITAQDSDGDCIPNDIETKYGYTDPNNADTDGDLVRDGCEDYNHNGMLDPGEMDPRKVDTDGDGIPDGIEDENHNGRRDIPFETDATNPDTDGDGIPDGVEDANHDGKVDVWVDVNGNGVFDPGIDIPGETDPRKVDTDGDGIGDAVEDRNHNGTCDVVWTLTQRPPPCNQSPILVGTGETCAFIADSDNDGLPDGKEDRNGDGIVGHDFQGNPETNPLDPDTDRDCLLDGVEDANHDGHYDKTTETNPVSPDSDFDGIPDGLEDRNWNGKVDPFVSSDPHGCFTNDSDLQGETDPRKADSDGDGIPDGLEDTDHDGLCKVEMLPSRLDPTKLVRTFTETCAWLADTDCDGLPDGLEDLNHNGKVDPGETDPRDPDTDLDGLPDGCPAWLADSKKCEDKNNDGIVEIDETDPLNYDTDADGLSDGCERNFAPGAFPSLLPPDPLNADSDGDGVLDGDEDANHNCQVDGNETDPRVFNAPPGSGTLANAQFQVCAAQNLKPLTWARTARPELDYQLAFEVERATSGAVSEYIVAPFGHDNTGDGAVTDPLDALYGHVFQSSRGVTPDESSPLHEIIDRQIYGFVIANESTNDLDSVLDDVRNALAAQFPDFVVSTQTVKGIEQFGALTARPAHDDLPAFPVWHAQRQFHVRVSSPTATLPLRNEILLQTYLHGATPDPAGVPPVVDATYNLDPPQYQSFTLYIGAAQRPLQKGPGGQPIIVSVVALTPDDSATPEPAPHLYAERLTRLEDLTGGSALARSENPVSNTCETKNVKKADADLLWVVDDSSSMQSLIKHLQNAASDAHAVLSANSNVVDFRVAMTTTNPSAGARAQCYMYNTGTKATCNALCTDDASSGSNCAASCADQWLGCMYVCPAGCVTNPAADCNAQGQCTCNSTCSASCGGSGKCIDPSALALGIAADVSLHPLPGGGGTFYYEDAELLDCNSATSAGQAQFINYCGNAPYGTEFAPFLAALPADAGFLGSDYTATCTTQTMLMDLSADPSMGGTTCAPGASFCCPRLTAACTDGPTVLESGMCDLIRAMGGLPSTSQAQRTGRAHASTENGSRSARRLLSTMLPALPRNYAGSYDKTKHLRRECCSTCDPSADVTCRAECCSACDPLACPPSNPSCCNKASVSGGANDLTCNISASCGPCDPRTDPSCVTSPLVTLFLSDEEDFFFKDECHVSTDTSLTVASVGVDTRDIDQAELPRLCRYRDGDPSTLEPCEDTYCAQFATDPPSGYNPDQTAWTNDTNARFASVRLRPACFNLTTQTACNAADGCAWIGGLCQGATTDSATCGGLSQSSCTGNAACAWIGTACYGVDAACSPRFADRSTTCAGDPCPQLRDATSCNAYSTFYSDAKFATLGLSDTRLCVWDATAGLCRNACADKVKTYKAVGSGTYAAAQSACSSDRRCQFDPSLMNSAGDMTRTCQLALEVNDCRACKRWRRTREALEGESGKAARCSALTTAGACDAAFMCGWSGSSCVPRSVAGLGFAGPVYAIAREAGKPGSGGYVTGSTSPVTVDDCHGGNSTWGLGEGAAYRQLAIDTQGRTQNVCAQSYKDFMQLLVTDIVALSAPYPLLGAPISATIKVGRARPLGNNTWDYQEVPRSTTRGFVYNVTTNSIGFKSDPIPGDCTYQDGWVAGMPCTAAGQIASAQNVPFIPKATDLIFISYRYWLPVPCRDQCDSQGETCSRVLCDNTTPQPTCSSAADCVGMGTCVGGHCQCTSDLECPDVNDRCVSGKCTCTQSTVVDRCRPEACAECQVFDPTSKTCVPATSSPGTCACYDPATLGCAPGGPNSCQPCTPGAQNDCPIGEACDSSACVCLAVGSCPGAPLNAQGDFSIDLTKCPTDLSQCAECQAALNCCSQWQTDATACAGYSTSTSCNGNASCVWASQVARCVSKTSPSPCCSQGETPTCYLVAEPNGTANAGIWCQPPVCSCQAPGTCDTTCAGKTQGTCASTTCAWDSTAGKCHAKDCQSWQTCDGASAKCTPACNPLTQFCAESAGCVCLDNPG